MKKFCVEYQGYFTVEANSEDEAFTKVFDKLNEVISPLCNRKLDDDWEITDTTEEE